MDPSGVDELTRDIYLEAHRRYIDSVAPMEAFLR